FATGAEFLQYSQGDLNRTLDTVRQTSASWIRLGIDRSQIETSPGVYNWSTSDRVINAARARGLRVLGLIAYTPLLQGGGLLKTAPPANPNDFAVFAQRAVQRYGSQVNNWEIWNEPNLPIFFGNIPNKSAAYARLIRATYPAIKAVQPNSTVIAAGLSPMQGSDSPVAFVNDLYRFGAKNSFDALALHPYVFPGGIGSNPNGAYTDIAAVRGLMVRNGDAGKKIWFTELGAPSNGARFGGNTPDGQRDIIASELAALAQLPFAGPAFVYTIRDTANDPGSLNNRESRFGALLTSDYKLKPTYFLLKR
ncbi:hypothetical protein, partial [Williamsia deligens]